MPTRASPRSPSSDASSADVSGTGDAGDAGDCTADDGYTLALRTDRGVSVVLAGDGADGGGSGSSSSLPVAARSASRARWSWVRTVDGRTPRTTAASPGVIST
jgi:hypothetical protein